MLNIEKSLVYITTSLKSNEIVMEKTLRGKIIKLYEEDEDLLVTIGSSAGISLENATLFERQNELLEEQKVVFECNT